MKTHFVKITIISLSLLLSMTGCESMESRWQEAKGTNTIDGYERFIVDYPDCPYNDSAQVIIIELQFKYAKKLNTILAYEEFLINYSDSEYAEQAKNRLIQLHFQDASQKNTIEAYTEFISRFPNEKEIEDANAKIAELQYNEVKQKNTASDYQEFIEQYPQSLYSNEARNEVLNIYANKINESDSYKNQEQFENDMIMSILSYGVGDRFVLKSILPEKNSQTGSIAAESVGENSSYINLKTLYPKDEIRYSISQFGAKPIMPFGNKSIWRFIGDIDFKDYTIIGNKNKPLTFMLLNNVGFVYLHGRGTVSKDGNLIITFN